jgi:hypothetical protein
MAVVAFLLAPLPTPQPVGVCGGTQTTGPNGEIKCAGLPAVPSDGIVPRAIDFR